MIDCEKDCQEHSYSWGVKVCVKNESHPRHKYQAEICGDCHINQLKSAETAIKSAVYHMGRGNAPLAMVALEQYLEEK